MHRAGASGEWVVKAITAMSDTLINKLFHCITADLSSTGKSREQLALVAIGGYGRGELNPYSDIDLMFLYNGKDSRNVEEIAQKLLYFLWDMRLDVGYSVRTLKDCVEMANADTTVKTALLDARFLVRQPYALQGFPENDADPDPGQGERFALSRKNWMK